MFPAVFRTAQSQRNRIFLHHSLRLNLRLSPARIAIQRCLAIASSSRKPTEDINVKHSTFLAQASSHDTWEKHSNGSVDGGYDAHNTELDSIADDKGVKQFARAASLWTAPVLQSHVSIVLQESSRQPLRTSSNSYCLWINFSLRRVTIAHLRCSSCILRSRSLTSVA